MIGIARTRHRLIAAATVGCIGIATTSAQQVRMIEQPNVYIRSEVKKQDPDAPARLARLVDDLGSPDFKTRSRADRALTEDGSFSLAMIEHALKERGTSLTLDTRERLCSAARARFNSSPRAAMGIQFWQNFNLRDRVVIERTFPKFDSSTKLEDGDMVVEADGVKINGPRAQQRIQSVIVSHDPGDVIPLVVRRGDRKLNLDVRLGRRDELENNTGVTPDVLERAWRVRSESILGPAQQAIRPPYIPEDWTDRQGLGQARMNRAALRQKIAGMSVAGIGPSVVGGGMPRGVEQAIDAAEQRQLAGGQIIRRNGQIFINGMVLAPAFDPMADTTYPPMKPQEELIELARARAQYAAAGGKAGVIRRPGMDGQVVLMQDVPGKEVAIIDKQIAAIRAELVESGQPVPDTAETATHDAVEGKPGEAGPGAP